MQYTDQGGVLFGVTYRGNATSSTNLRRRSMNGLVFKVRSGRQRNVCLQRGDQKNTPRILQGPKELKKNKVVLT